MASFSVGLTELVSPMARPGNRSPPSPGSPDAASRKSRRTASAAASSGGGAPARTASPRRNTRKAASSPGSVAARVPVARSREPIRAPRIAASSRSPNTSTGVDSPEVAPATRAASAVPGRRPSVARPVTSITNSTTRPACAASTSTAGARAGAWATTEVVASAPPARARTTRPRHAPGSRRTDASTASAHRATVAASVHGELGAATAIPAPIHPSTAAGRRRRSAAVVRATSERVIDVAVTEAEAVSMPLVTAVMSSRGPSAPRKSSRRSPTRSSGLQPP